MESVSVAMLWVWKGQCTVKPFRPRRDGGGSCELVADPSVMWPASAAVAARTPTPDDFEVVGREVLVEDGSTLRTCVSICCLNCGMMAECVRTSAL